MQHNIEHSQGTLSLHQLVKLKLHRIHSQHKHSMHDVERHQDIRHVATAVSR